jgi:hypothetical protein
MGERVRLSMSQNIENRVYPVGAWQRRGKKMDKKLQDEKTSQTAKTT